LYLLTLFYLKHKKNIPIEELSSLLHVSKSTLDKKIRKRTNKISQYIREFKLDYALKLIYLGKKHSFLVDETIPCLIFLRVLRNM
jgi:transcriptional antiterminator